MNGDNYGSRTGGGKAVGSRTHGGLEKSSEHRRDRDRPERDRGDRADRNERGRSDRGSRSERSDRHERSGRSERDRGDRSDRGDRNERGDRERGDRHRERSRSPGYRSSRGSRRDYYDEARFDRNREREADRHGRLMDIDQEFERERRAGRDRERERLSRYDDARRERKRSATPPVKKREPTPDLTDVVPINERKRRLTMWDIKPQGYENVTAEQAKLSGMFPLPGAPRQTPMDPSRLQAFINPVNNAAQSTALKPTNSRQAKRLIISNLPDPVSEEGLMTFFNSTLSNLNVIQNTDPVTNILFNAGRKLGLVEFKSSEDTTVALAFDGIEFNGTKLDLRRPRDYIVPLIADSVHRRDNDQGGISSMVLDTPNKIAISNIPLYLGDEQVIELLKSFGDLKSFVLLKEKETDESKGIAFCEYVDPSTTEIAVEGLNGMELGEASLRVRLASIGVKQAAGVELGVHAMAMMAGTTSTELATGRVLQLLNMVTPEELMDTEEYEEICEDIQDECSKFGNLIDMKVPRPTGGSRQSAGVGKIYVRFETNDAAAKALRALAGRKFQDRTVVCTYFSEENYEVGAF